MNDESFLVSKRALGTRRPMVLPDRINERSDQGSQFTSFKWIETLRKAGVKISMDGKGRLMDNQETDQMAQRVA